MNAPPPSGDVRRQDTERLREFLQRATRLRGRMREVATLCIEHGLSLSQCAERLGISRETVRVQLRRLRSLERRSSERRRQVEELLAGAPRRRDG